MARLASTLAVLFFLFAFSYARNSLNFHDDKLVQDLPNSLPENHNEPITALPKPETESIMLSNEWETKSAEIYDDKKAVTEEDSPASESTLTVKAVPLERPLTILRLRPINRHFPAMRQYPFRLHRRGCHHGMMKPRGHRGDVSYGNDMILATESKDLDLAMFNGGMRKIPERWMKFDDHHHRHHHDGMPKFKFSGSDKFAKQSFRKSFHEEEEEHEENKEGGLAKRFRKFIDDLF